MTTVIKQCTCQHKYQDSKYGTGMRVMNQKAKKERQPTVYKCTVCKKEHQ